MKHLIVHLSDIHIEASGEILRRRSLDPEEIGTAIAPLFQEAESCIIVVSGDIAYSGLQSEYDYAKVLLRGVREKLSECRRGCTVRVLLVPGNHDCDFSQETKARSAILDNEDVLSEADASVVDVCAAVLDNYRSFAKPFMERESIVRETSLLTVVDVRMKEETLRFALIATPWCSQESERQGSLHYPANTELAGLQNDGERSAVISVFHHPYSWMHQGGAHSFRESVEAISDLVITGHEHHSDGYTRTGLQGEVNEYLEGGVLGPRDEGDASFNAVVIDTVSRLQWTHQYRWNGARYHSDPLQVLARPFAKNKSRLRASYQVHQDFYASVLNNPEVSFTHPRKEKLELSDLFVYPDARDLKAPSTGTSQATIPSRAFLSTLMQVGKCLIVGDTQSGKTALSRRLFQDLRHNGIISVLASGREIAGWKKRGLVPTINAMLKQQYQDDICDAFWSLDPSKRGILIDGIDDVLLGRGLDVLLAELESRFDTVILLADTQLHTRMILDPQFQDEGLRKYGSWELLEFGHFRRHELIEKWYFAGRPTMVLDGSAERDLIHIEALISSLLSRDLVTPYPIFVLLMLQALEARTKLALAPGSAGLLYEELITASLRKAGTNPNWISAAYEYLSELAHAMYLARVESLDEGKVKVWHSEFCDERDLEFPYESTVDSFVRSQLLIRKAGTISFNYPYIYYYFAAKYITTHLEQDSAKEEIRRLVGSIHNEASANIVLFICHLSNHQFVIDAILGCADALFVDQEPLVFGEGTKFLDELNQSVPSLILPGSSPKENREEMMANADEVARGDAEPRADAAEEAREVSRTLSDLNAAGKMIQILGQVLRTSITLHKDRKSQVARACYGLGLRSVGSLMNALQASRHEVLEDYMIWLKKAHPEWTSGRIQQEASSAIFNLTQMITLGMIKHVSTSIGLRELAKTFASVLDSGGSNTSYRLIDLSIKLDYSDDFPLPEAEALSKQLHSSAFARTVLRNLVWLHYYLYPDDDYQTKQRICNLLNIKVEKTLLPNPRRRSLPQ